MLVDGVQQQPTIDTERERRSMVHPEGPTRSGQGVDGSAAGPRAPSGCGWRALGFLG